MSKALILQAVLTAIQSGQNQVLSDAIGNGLDQMAAEVQANLPAPSAPAPAPSSGGFQQSDIDAAVAAQAAKDTQALSDAQASAANLQSQLDALVAKEGLEEASVASLQGEISQISLILSPAPAPSAPSAPAPMPAPVDSSPASPDQSAPSAPAQS
jgi:hypothetical protein